MTSQRNSRDDLKALAAGTFLILRERRLHVMTEIKLHKYINTKKKKVQIYTKIQIHKRWLFLDPVGSLSQCDGGGNIPMMGPRPLIWEYFHHK